MDSSLSDRNPVEELAEEFVARIRRGERPSLMEYTDRFPELAEQIRALFPTLLLMEKVRPDPATADLDGSPGADGAHPERLGDYRIIREVGHGGMGIVYEAEQESLGRHVALKVLPSHAVLDPRHLQRFKREARAAGRLHHTNIVPVHGVGEHDGRHYYVMQFIQGQGLDQVLAELRRLRQAREAVPAEPADGTSAAAVARSLLSGQFDGKELAGAEAGSRTPVADAGAGMVAASSSVSGVYLPGRSEKTSLSEAGWQYWHSVARIGIQVAEALAYAASQGILHRDIKPSNLLLDTRGTVWVTDFGLAKAETDHDNVTTTGDIVGTLRYLAPERFKGQADVRGDLYALGLTLYELLTLRPAFDETDRHKLIAQVMHDQPPRPSQFEPTIPRDLETIVLKATAREPAQRYQTPAELAEDLQRFLDDRPIKARRQGPVQLAWRWCRRNPMPATLGGAIAALLLVIAVGSSVMLLQLQGEQALTLKELKRAEKAEKVAVNAEKDGQEKLWESYLAVAQARHWSGKPGRHFESLEALERAAAIRYSPDLRNEAIACMPLVDLRVARKWSQDELPFKSLDVHFDAALERYAVSDKKGNITICRVADGAEMSRLPGRFYSLAEAIQFSADGQYLVARYQGDPHALVWTLAPPKYILVIPMPPGLSGSAAQVFSSDMRQLIIGLGDRSLRVYDLASRKKVKEHKLAAAASWMSLHPDGRTLAIATWNQRTLKVLDLETGKFLHEFTHPATVNEIAWHPAGTLLAAACAEKVYLWDVVAIGTTKPKSDIALPGDDTLRTDKPREILTGHQNSVHRCAFNHGGNVLASYGDDGMTRLWDPIAGKELLSIQGQFLRFSADDRFLAYRGHTEVGIWEVATGRECRSFHALNQKVHGPWTVEFQPKGRLLASTNDDGVRLWDRLTGKELETLPGGRNKAFFGPSGDWLLTIGARGIMRWPIHADAQSGSLRLGPSQTITRVPLTHHTSAALSKDGRYLAAVVALQRAAVIDLEQPSNQVSLGDHLGVSNVAISPDGQWVVTGTQHGSGLKVWDARNGKLVRDLPAGAFSAGRFSPDGKWLVTSSHGEGTHLRAVGTWDVRHHLSKERSSDLAITKDSSLLALTDGLAKVIFLIDLAKGEKLATLPAPNPLVIGGMCFSEDGSQLALACYNHQTIQLWDLRAIRARLRDLKLDWDLPAYPPAEDAAQKPLQIKIVAK